MGIEEDSMKQLFAFLVTIAYLAAIRADFDDGHFERLKYVVDMFLNPKTAVDIALRLRVLVVQDLDNDA